VRGDVAAPLADDFRYDVDARWEKPPAGISHRDVSAVDTDSQDRVYLLTRYDSNLLVYEPDGTFITAWGGENFTNLPSVDRHLYFGRTFGATSA